MADIILKRNAGFMGTGGKLLRVPVDPCVASLDTGLIGYYKLDDSTDTIVDSVNGYNLTNNGGNLQASGLINQCVEFDGISLDSISGNTIYHDSTSDELSISGWVKRKDGTTTQQIIFSSRYYMSNQGYLIPNVYLNAASMNAGFRWYSGGSVGVLQAQDYDWHNFIIMAKLSTNTIYWAWDGGTINGTSISPGLISKYDGRLFIGSSYSGDYSRLKGYIDNIAIWNRLLTQCEVTANFNNRSGVEYNY